MYRNDAVLAELYGLEEVRNLYLAKVVEATQDTLPGVTTPVKWYGTSSSNGRI